MYVLRGAIHERERERERERENSPGEFRSLRRTTRPDKDEVRGTSKRPFPKSVGSRGELHEERRRRRLRCCWGDIFGLWPPLGRERRIMGGVHLPAKAHCAMRRSVCTVHLYSWASNNMNNTADLRLRPRERSRRRQHQTTIHSGICRFSTRRPARCYTLHTQFTGGLHRQRQHRKSGYFSRGVQGPGPEKRRRRRKLTKPAYKFCRRRNGLCCRARDGKRKSHGHTLCSYVSVCGCRAKNKHANVKDLLPGAECAIREISHTALS